MSEPAAVAGGDPERSERSVVRIEINSKGQAQTKIAVYAGESEAEMERLSLLALKIHEQLQAALGNKQSVPFS